MLLLWQHKASCAKTSSSVNHPTHKIVSNVKIYGFIASSLMDAGSSDCYINRKFVEKHSLNVVNCCGSVTLAETSVRMPIRDQCLVNLQVKENQSRNAAFNVLNNLSTDVKPLVDNKYGTWSFTPLVGLLVTRAGCLETHF